MDLKQAITENLNSLQALVSKLNPSDYSKPITLLDDASIGKHVRHIIELFACLQNQSVDNYVNYDVRPRNLELETNPLAANAAIEQIINTLRSEQKTLRMHAQISSEESIFLETNLERELLYNLEHSIHHQAIIKIALNSMGIVLNTKHFGYSPSTIKYNLQNQTS